MNITKKHVKLGAAVFAGGLGATAGPAGALVAVAASQYAVEGCYHAASVIRNREEPKSTEAVASTEETEQTNGFNYADDGQGGKVLQMH